jgi:hypothetical protein
LDGYNFCFITVGVAQFPQYYQYSCHLINARLRKCFRANVFKIAEDFDAYSRQTHDSDGIFPDEKNIKISLIFKQETMMNRFQSTLLQQITAVSGKKRPYSNEVNQNLENADYNDIYIQQEAFTHVPYQPDMSLKRVYRYEYKHEGESPPCDTFSDTNSFSILSAEVVSIVEAETRVQMLENHTHSFFIGKNPEIAHIKDKAKSSPSERKDSNNRLHLSRFLHEHFDGINSIPTNTPSFKVHYVSHEVTKVDCPIIGNGATIAFPHIKRHRTLVHIIFYNYEKRNLLQQFFRDGLKIVNDHDLTLEMDLYFADANSAKIYLDWKEKKTQGFWDNLDI